MGFFRNKYFLFGILLLLAVAIPLTVYIMQREQDLQSSAAPTSTLSFSPPTQTVDAGEEFTIDVSVDPGENFVSFVQFGVEYDPQHLEVLTIEPNIEDFPLTLEGPTIGNGSAGIAVGIGSDVTSAIQTSTQVVTIRFSALSETGGQATDISFVTPDTQVLSLSVDDEPGENVLSSASPASVTILAGGGDVAPTTAPPDPTEEPQPTEEPDPTPVPDENESPVCTTLSVSPSTSGVAPFAVNFTAEGNDPDGTITKATFNFGDGDVQDIFDGLGTQTASAQASHTYSNEGSYSATVTFTDDQNSISQSCTQAVQVTGDEAPDATSEAQPTATPLPTKPPIDDPGGIVETVGIAGAVILTIVGGIWLLAL